MKKDMEREIRALLQKKIYQPDLEDETWNPDRAWARIQIDPTGSRTAWWRFAAAAALLVAFMLGLTVGQRTAYEPFELSAFSGRDRSAISAPAEIACQPVSSPPVMEGYKRKASKKKVQATDVPSQPAAITEREPIAIAQEDSTSTGLQAVVQPIITQHAVAPIEPIVGFYETSTPVFAEKKKRKRIRMLNDKETPSTEPYSLQFTARIK